MKRTAEDICVIPFRRACNFVERIRRQDTFSAGHFLLPLPLPLYIIIIYLVFPKRSESDKSHVRHHFLVPSMSGTQVQYSPVDSRGYMPVPLKDAFHQKVINYMTCRLQVALPIWLRLQTLADQNWWMDRLQKELVRFPFICYFLVFLHMSAFRPLLSPTWEPLIAWR